ncbi:MAG: GDP-L-fucose synthase [Pseudomonadota bacterium]
MASYNFAGKRVYVAGHRGMVGSAIVRRLQTENPGEIITATSQEVDLRNQSAADALLKDTKPDAVFIPAAKVGGILANDSYPAEFLYDNLMIAANVIHASYRAGVEKLLFLGSSCIYPKMAPQPLVEDALLTGPLEPTNEWYAIAKIAGIKLCQAYRRQYGADFISAMPSNLYGPGDNYHPENSHVLPALIRKAHNAKESGAQTMEIWGSGKPRREFLHVDDCADGLVHLFKSYSDESHINVGSGTDVTIEELTRLVMNAVGFDGSIVKDESKPDGTPRKMMDIARIQALGWSPKIGLPEGIAGAYQDFLENHAAA